MAEKKKGEDDIFLVIPHQVMAERTFESMLRRVSIAPLGSPVVPEV